MSLQTAKLIPVSEFLPLKRHLSSSSFSWYISFFIGSQVKYLLSQELSLNPIYSSFFSSLSNTSWSHLICLVSHPFLSLFLATWASFSSLQSLSHVRLFVTPWISGRQASLSITNSQSSLKLTFIESVMPSSHLIFGHPLLLLPLIPPSIRVFSKQTSLKKSKISYSSPCP